jgi:hypothetical protein
MTWTTTQPSYFTHQLGLARSGSATQNMSFRRFSSLTTTYSQHLAKLVVSEKTVRSPHVVADSAKPLQAHTRSNSLTRQHYLSVNVPILGNMLIPCRAAVVVSIDICTSQYCSHHYKAERSEALLNRQTFIHRNIAGDSMSSQNNALLQSQS